MQQKSLKKTLAILFVSIFSLTALSQLRFSISSDISILRNFKPHQQFWSYGQKIKADFASNKEGLYIEMCYFAPGRFRDPLSASAKSPSTIPQQIFFSNHAKVQLKEFSIGWKHFIKGNNEAESVWNFYSLVGFGIIFGKAENNYSQTVDTSLYTPPVNPVSGVGHFKRLSFDVGLGFEFPIADEIYFYTEGRVCIPTTDYPSKYLYENNNAPYPAMIGAGIRVLF